MKDDFTEHEAFNRLMDKIKNIDWFKNASIGRIHELDLPPFFCFSVMPEATGKAGEVIYLVGPERILTSGNSDDFTWLVKKLGIGEVENPISVNQFVNLFLKMKAGRQGILLHPPDGHVLLKPEQIPEDRFIPPAYLFSEAGANYTFWVFDTSLYKPAFYTVLVHPDGKVEYECKD